MKLKFIISLVPLLLFILLAIFLWRGLHNDPHHVPSALMNKPVPQFSLYKLAKPEQTFTNKALLGHVSLLNVWASWCITCRVEHPVLMDIARQNIVPIYSLDYKDQRQRAQHWLSQYGNPYQQTGFDKDGRVAINFGVYGTPETFVIDRHGVVRYKLIGAINHEIWQNTILPLINKLTAEKKQS